MLINGKSVSAKETFDVLDPATLERIDSAPRATTAELDGPTRMRRFAAKALLVGAAIASFACTPQSGPADVAKRLTEVSRETLVAELASVADGPMRPAFVTFLSGMNFALDGVDDVESAIAKRSMLVILTDRLSGIDRQQVEPPSAASREGAERRLDELQAWRQYEANLARLSPETVGQIGGPLDMMVLFFERQNRRP